jgi:hypothetical protein
MTRRARRARAGLRRRAGRSMRSPRRALPHPRARRREDFREAASYLREAVDSAMSERHHPARAKANGAAAHVGSESSESRTKTESPAHNGGGFSFGAVTRRLATAMLATDRLSGISDSLKGIAEAFQSAASYAAGL